jgi:hypothetical protein
MRWIVLASVILALLVATFAVVLGSAWVPCRSELHALPEPASWRDWPVVVGPGEYVVTGTPYKMPGYAELHVTGPGICEDGVLSLDTWLHGPSDGPWRPDTWKRPETTTLRRDPAGTGTWVVEGLASEHTRDTEFAAAFERTDGRWGCISSDYVAGLWVLGGTIAVLIVSLVRARHALKMARELEDTELWRDGVRDGAGTLRLLEDGTVVVEASHEPWSSERRGPSGATGLRPPGQVLVRVGGASAGTYRHGAAVKARAVRELPGGSREAAVRALRKSASAAAAGPVVCIAGIVLLGLLAPFCAFVAFAFMR